MLKTSCIAYLFLKCLSLCITGVLKPVTGNMHTTIWFQEQWTFFFKKKRSPFFMAPVTRSSSFHTGPVIWIQTRLVVMSVEWPIRTKFLVSIQFPMERSQAAETTVPSGSAVSGISHGVSCPSATGRSRGWSSQVRAETHWWWWHEVALRFFGCCTHSPKTSFSGSDAVALFRLALEYW